MTERISGLLLASVIGAFAGICINLLAVRLPPLLHRHWRREAQELLGMAMEDDEAPASTHFGPIRLRSVLVCALCTILTVTGIYHVGPNLQGVAFVLLSWALLALSLIDWDHLLLPDIIVFPLLWAGLIVNQYGLFTSSTDALWGAVVGYGGMWIMSKFALILTGTKGIGGGDLKLVAAIGAWAGLETLTYIIMLASVLGGLAHVLRLSFNTPHSIRGAVIPFGPFLAIAGWVCMAYNA